MKLGYRPDIDGLRAIAVAGVVLYHYGATWLPGGFTGVDVFFVISGFLITSILRAEIERDKFSLKVFYLRRLRRIFPALLVMLTILLAAGWWLLMPADYVALAKSSKYSALGLANFYFLRNTGYFDTAADLQPLLHIWSLGVEEQFYFVWPLLLFLGMRTLGTGRSFVATLATVVLFGFAYAVWNVSLDPKGAFYLPHARAWELAIGALVAFLPAIQSSRLSRVAAAIGALFVIISLTAIRSNYVFPGMNAGWAVVGAGLIVWPKRANAVSSVLAWRPFVALGLISYSLYLWHWPILVYFRYFNLERSPSPTESVVLLTIAIAVSIASYFLVEKPSRRQMLINAIAPSLGAAAVIGVSIIIPSAKGFPMRMPADVARLADAANDFSSQRSRCHRGDDFTLPLQDSCKFGMSETPDVAMWGDSHGVELAEAIGSQLAAEHRSIVNLSYSSCPPSIGYRSPLQKGCEAFTTSARDYLTANKQIRTVVLAAHYELYFREPGGEFERGFSRAVEDLLAFGKHVVIIASTPKTGFSIPLAAARLERIGRLDQLVLPMAEHRKATRQASDMLNKIAAKFPSVTIVDPTDALCSRGICNMVQDGHPILFDDNHLSRAAASQVSAKISIDRIFASRGD
ncbi:acyltransferase family protein [Neorhizobium sp. IRAMC:178]|uniref:acyltransferase family protein n=1 Tax=Neorhizobium tunisiense TaxID=3144793 RepID=UPI0031F6853F